MQVMCRLAPPAGWCGVGTAENKVWGSANVSMGFVCAQGGVEAEVRGVGQGRPHGSRQACTSHTLCVCRKTKRKVNKRQGVACQLCANRWDI